ncbi:ankyrin repeat-containing domain protein, partial [Baffinella frigidus]
MKVVRALLDSGANAGVTTRGGATPLHYAAGQGRVGVALLLLAAGAGVSAANRSGRTPLHWLAAAACA